MSNRLASEKSLYLQQHANNPVNWWPWCDEAFEVAEKENKLVIVSIGYSSCHWCHVMAHECFEDRFIANLMNDNYICIKVDREERPDIDQLYMEAVQMITQRGGWPLNVFCLPNGQPFFGGTYFPAKDKGQGIVPFPQLLMRINEHYKRNPSDLVENADNIVKNLAITSNPNAGLIKNEDFEKFVLGLASTYDEDWGGFGGAPKFPPSMILDFYISFMGSKLCEFKPELKEKVKGMVEHTLKAMAHGGIYDQLGGGFMRYSVDQYWLVPHFEKMLYDNGLHLSIYAKGWQNCRNPLLERVIEETVAWLDREMRLDFGPWAASLDADSGGSEGAFYMWSRDEVSEVLGADAKVFCEAYNVSEDKKSVLAWVYDDMAKREELRPMREKLLAARQNREKPGRDDKVISGWNALVVKGLADAAYVFGRKEWMKRAMEVGDWIWDNMVSEGRLKRVYGQDLEGFLDDYAYLIDAYLALGGKGDWAKDGASKQYIDRAKELMDRVLECFGDDKLSGFYYASSEHETAVLRKKTWWDEAIPSGNGVMVNCLSGLYALTGDERYHVDLEELRKGFGGIAHKGSNGVASALSGYVKEAIGVGVLKAGGDLESVRKALMQRSFREVYVLADGGYYQLCVGPQCEARTESLDEVISKL